MERKFGYARVSTVEQNLDRQILALKEYVKEENIIVDKSSGKNLERPGYQALKGAMGLRKGDTLYIMSLDRLSRNKSDIKEELQWFKSNDINLRILELPTSMIELPSEQKWIGEMVTNILIEVMSSMAERERMEMRKRQKQGIEAARLKGKHLGRPRIKMPDNFAEIYSLWKSEEITAKEAMRAMNIKSNTFYRFVKKYENESVAKGSKQIEKYCKK